MIVARTLGCNPYLTFMNTIMRVRVLPLTTDKLGVAVSVGGQQFVASYIV